MTDRQTSMTELTEQNKPNISMITKVNDSLYVTNLVHGPFVILAIETEREDGLHVIGPPKGFEEKHQALEYIQQYAKRKEPYLGMIFKVLQFSTPGGFNVYCSWEG